MAHGSSNSCGVAILVKKGVDCTIHSKTLDPLGGYVILKAEINDKMYVLINFCAPNKDANIIKFLNNLLMTLRKIASAKKRILLKVEILTGLLIQSLIRKEVC